MFTGSSPVLVITDPALICEVMIRQFDSFTNHKGLTNFSPKYFRKGLLLLRDEEWKSVRKILSPTFTGAKLQKLAPCLDEIGDQLCRKFDKVLQSEDQEFELISMFRSCTMDIICNVLFGITVDSQVVFIAKSETKQNSW